MKSRKKVLLTVLLVLCIAVFTISALYVGKYLVESGARKEEFDALADLVESIRATAPNETELPESQPTVFDETDADDPAVTEPLMLPEYAALYAMNPDVVGWLQIEGTNINYPVMQTPQSPDYYLHTSFQKQYSAQGCLYARETCSVTEPSDNVTIYGHNMRDGSMFYDLDHYRKRSYWEEHDTIRFDTLTERHTYKIFAVFTTSATKDVGFSYHLFENAADEAEFDDFIATCTDLSLYKTGITPTYGDKLICLSTCEYSQVNGRLVVVAYRVS